MKQTAFFRELSSLWKSAMGILLVMILLLIPSFFAWFSLAANWDPMEDARGIRVAVVCPEDAWSQPLEEALAEESSFTWRLMEKQQALDGIRSGRYYAALILPEGFEEELLASMRSGGEAPRIDYYVNQRKSAAIPAASLQKSGLLELQIRSSFSQVLAGLLGREAAAETLAGLPEGDPGENLSQLLDTASGELKALEDALDQLKPQEAEPDPPAASAPALPEGSTIADLLENAVPTAALARSQAGSAFKSSGEAGAALLDESRETSRKLAELYRTAAASLGDGGAASSMRSLFQEGARRQDRILDTLSAAAEAMRSGGELESGTRSQLVSMLDEAKGDAGYIYRAYSNSALPAQAVVSAPAVPVQPPETAPADPEAEKERQALLARLADLEETLSHSREQLEAFRAQSAHGDSLEDLLQSQPEAAGNLLAASVRFDEQRLYARENYGSALAPGYTSAALWLGAVLLAMFLRSPEGRGRPFLSRTLVVMLLGMLQATLLCFGELFFLGIQCANPFLFLLAGWISGIVYSGIVYAITYLLGKGGIAAGILLLTVQLAGATGVFPIEMLPGFFQAVYGIQPFARGMAALEETIGGVYTAGYVWNLTGLALWLAAALLAGVFLRRPCVRLRQFLRRRLAGTDLL